MAEVRLRCDIDGCGASWLVKPAQMKRSMAEHRVKFHPDWVQPEPKTASAYRLDYSSRARKF
jgi:hypothetical protein